MGRGIGGVEVREWGASSRCHLTCTVERTEAIVLDVQDSKATKRGFGQQP